MANYNFGTGEVEYGASELADKKNRLQNAMNGGIDTSVDTNDLVKSLNAMNIGSELGKRQFSGSADWQDLKKRREDLAKGYSGQELGALRESSRQELAGQRQAALQRLRSNMAASGVGGARAAALAGNQDVQQQRTAADTERKMLLDEGNVKRQGVNDLQDFIMREKMGEAGYTFGTASLQSASDAAKAAAQANSSGKK